MIYLCAMVSISYALYQVGHTENSNVIKVDDPTEIYFVHDIYGDKVPDKIKEWDLSNTLVDDNITSYIKYFHNLKTVNFGSQKLDDNIIINLIEDNKDINFIYRVYIGNKSFSSQTSHLDLSNSYIADYDDLINKMKLLPNLKSADFSNCNLSNQQLGNL